MIPVEMLAIPVVTRLVTIPRLVYPRLIDAVAIVPTPVISILLTVA
jgi:hypothetical protein